MELLSAPGQPSVALRSGWREHLQERMIGEKNIVWCSFSLHQTKQLIPKKIPIESNWLVTSKKNTWPKKDTWRDLANHIRTGLETEFWLALSDWLAMHWFVREQCLAVSAASFLARKSSPKGNAMSGFSLSDVSGFKISSPSLGWKHQTYETTWGIKNTPSYLMKQ